MNARRREAIAVLALLLPALSPNSHATTLSGHVTDAATVDAIAGATVSGSKLFSNVSFQTTTDAEGYYQVELIDGPYAVTANASGYLQANDSANASGSPLVLDFALNKPATISGSVRELTSANALSHAIVLLMPLDQGIVGAEAVTADDGAYSISDLSPGHYKACVANPLDDYIDQCYDSQNLAASGSIGYTPIKLDSGQILSGVDFSLQTGSAISGTLTDLRFSVPAANSFPRFLLLSSDKALVAKIDTRTDASGSYSLGGIPAGDYYLAADANYHYSVPNSYYGLAYHADSPCSGPCTSDDASLVHVPVAGTASAIDLALPPGHVVTGKISDAQSGLGIAGVTVQTCEMPGLLFAVTAETTTGPDGTYALAHVVGNAAHLYTANTFGYVDIAWPDTPIYLSTYCDALDGSTLTFSSADQDLSGIDFALHSGAAISGRVTASEYPDRGVSARIQIWKSTDDGLSLAWSGTTDSDGYYGSNGLQTGTYYVLAEYDQFLQCQVYLGQSCDTPSGPPGVNPAQATAINVDEIATHGGVDLQLNVEIFHGDFD